MRWLRLHLGSIASELFEQAAIEVKPGEVLGKLVRTDPRELLRTVAAGEPRTCSGATSSGELIDRLLGDDGGRATPSTSWTRSASASTPATRICAARSTATASAAALDALVSRLLGLELKMAQYRRGKASRDAVAAEVGVKGSAWSGARPRTCRAAPELEAPVE